MRNLTRTLAASAAAVPLLFVGTGAAFAAEDTSADVDTATTLSAGYDSDRYDVDDNGILSEILGDDILGGDDNDDFNNEFDNEFDNDDDGILGGLLS